MDTNTMDAAERELLRFLSRDDIDAGTIDAVFEIEGRDLGPKLGRRLLIARRRRAFESMEDLLRVRGIGPKRLAIMIGVASRGLPPPEGLVLPSDMAPFARGLGEAMLGGCGTIGDRLRDAAAQARRYTKLPLSGRTADELTLAAEAIDARTPTEPITSLIDAVTIPPVTKSVLAQIPESLRRSNPMPTLRSEGQAVTSALARFQVFSTLATRAPSAWFDAVRWLTKRDSVAASMATIAGSSRCAMEVELGRAAMSLIAMASLLEVADEIVLACGCLDIGGGGDEVHECEHGQTRKCEAHEFTLVPSGRDADYHDDFQDASHSLTILSYVPKGRQGWGITPGGNRMIREIVDELGYIKSKIDEGRIAAYGYDVYVRITWEECSLGEWRPREHIVRTDPPSSYRASMKNRGSNTWGWSRKKIEQLGDANAPGASVRRLLTAIDRAAKAKCP